MPAGFPFTTFLEKSVCARLTSPRVRGLTLVELLVALALLGFVLLGVTPLFFASVKSNVAGSEYTNIHVLARDRLERLMSLPFSDPELAPGVHANDLARTLPDPETGVPPGSGGVSNPFKVCYQVFQFQIPSSEAVAPNGPFVPNRVMAAGVAYQYKRIDVTVTSDSGSLAIGTRKERVSGLLAHPAPGTILSTSDPDGICD